MYYFFTKEGTETGRDIIKQSVEPGITLHVRSYLKGKISRIYIEMGSNVLYVHEIDFSNRIIFKKGSPLKGKKPDGYYNRHAYDQ